MLWERDDGILVHPDKEYLNHALALMKEKLSELKLDTGDI